MADVVVRFDIEGSPTEPSIKELEQQTAQNNARAAQHQREAAALRQVAAQQQQYRVTAGIDAVRGEIEAAKAAYAQSLDRGEFAESAEAQERIATAAARLAQLEQVQNYYQSQPQAPQSTGDAVEDYARGRTEASANWIRNHPEYVRDPRKFSKLQAAHHEALANDLTPDSPKYFEHIERYTGLRGGGGMRKHSGDTGTVTLTPGEARTATDGTITYTRYDLAAGRCRPDQVNEPIGVKEFARRKQRMAAEGYYDRKLD